MLPAPNPTEVLTSLATDNLRRLEEERPANMSRRRFVFMQLNSLIIAILTCVTISAFWILNRVENINSFVAGPCGIGSLLLANLTGISIKNICANNTM